MEEVIPNTNSQPVPRSMDMEFEREDPEVFVFDEPDPLNVT